MSFGTAFWTDEPEKVWATIDTFIELEIPFVRLFRHHSPLKILLNAM